MTNWEWLFDTPEKLAHSLCLMTMCDGKFRCPKYVLGGTRCGDCDEEEIGCESGILKWLKEEAS